MDTAKVPIPFFTHYRVGSAYSGIRIRKSLEANLLYRNFSATWTLRSSDILFQADF